jgi:hypothetical protein
MKYYIYIIGFLLISCSSQIPNDQSNSMDTEKLIQDGFTELTLVKSQDAKCEFLLKNTEGTLFEVENLASKLAQPKLGDKVWIKYQMLRKMSICGAQPISIEEIYSK